MSLLGQLHLAHLLNARDGAEHMCVFSHVRAPGEIKAVLVLILQRKKLMFKEVQRLLEITQLLRGRARL